MEHGVSLTYQARRDSAALALAEGLQGATSASEQRVAAVERLLRKLQTQQPEAAAALERLAEHAEDVAAVDYAEINPRGTVELGFVMGSAADKAARAFMEVLLALGVSSAMCEVVCDEWEDEDGETWALRLTIAGDKLSSGKERGRV